MKLLQKDSHSKTYCGTLQKYQSWRAALDFTCVKGAVWKRNTLMVFCAQLGQWQWPSLRGLDRSKLVSESQARSWGIKGLVVQPMLYKQADIILSSYHKQVWIASGLHLCIDMQPMRSVHLLLMPLTWVCQACLQHLHSRQNFWVRFRAACDTK